MSICSETGIDENWCLFGLLGVPWHRERPRHKKTWGRVWNKGLNLRMYFEAMKFYTLEVVGFDKLDF